MIRTQIRKPIRRNHRSAFTLIEVLLVLGILVAIFAMVAPQLLGRQKTAMIKVTKGSIKSFEQAALLYAGTSNTADYPKGDTDAVVTLLMKSEDEDGNTIEPYLDKAPEDAWGNPIQYQFDGPGNSMHTNKNKPAIWSFGPDGVDNQGQGDDVSNWEDYEQN